jgi:hypothetical protein
MKKTRKTRELVEEAKQAAARLAEIEALREEAIREEREAMESIKGQIDGLCGEDYFCGVILTHQDLLQIIGLALDNNENIRIPYKLYNTD